MKPEDIKEGEFVWQAQKDLFKSNPEMIIQIELMVKEAGALWTYIACDFENNLPKDIALMMKKALFYLEYLELRKESKAI